MLEDSDFTGRVDLSGLPARAGRKATRDVRFIWSGDTAGQDWGLNEAWGGMKIYEQMRQVNPTFSCTAATPFTPTAQSRPRSNWPMARCETTWWPKT